MAARRVELRAGQRLSHEHVVVGELLGEPAPSGLHRQGWQELRARRPHAPGGGVLPCAEGAKQRVLLVRQLEQLVELEVGRSHGERIREPDLVHGDRRLHAHSAQEIQLRLVFQLGGAQQGDVGLALRHFGLTHVEERGLSDLVARASERQEVGIPDHLLPGHIHLGNRLQRVEVLGGDLVAEVDAGAGDVLFGGLLQRLLLAGTREDPPVELPVQSEAVPRGEERGRADGKATAEVGLPLADVAKIAGHAGGREEAAVGVAHAPPGRGGIVQGLPVRRAVRPSLVEGFLEGEGDRWGRAGGESGVRLADRRGVLGFQAHGRDAHDGEETEPAIH